MHRFYLLVKESEAAAPKRVDIDVVDRDRALHIAESYGGSANLELWEGTNLVAEMSRAAPHLWILRPMCDREG